jgi:sugar lactone lactonase YvrE
MRRPARALLTALAILLVAGEAGAHLIVDVKMSVAAPAYVAARQRFSYQVTADDLANDAAFGVVVTTTLPSSVTFVRASGSGWNCAESKLKVTCGAEQLAAGPNVITIEVNAPAASGAITGNVSVTSVGSTDPNAGNDMAAATTTVYDSANCPASTLQILQGSEPRLAWTPVPNAASYAVIAAVDGERSAVVATINATTISIPFEGGDVEWHVEAARGGCPPVVSEAAHFHSAGRPAALALATLPTASAFESPSGLAIDGSGDLFVADAGDFTIRKVSHGEVSTLSGIAGRNGAADGRPASFAAPMGMAITPLDDFAFIADRGNHAVRMRYPGDLSLGYVITIGGALGQPGMADGTFEASRFSSPSAVAGDPRGRIYVADSGNHRIRKLISVPGYTGLYTSATFAGGEAGSVDGPLAQARFSNPAGIAVDGEETIWVADSGNHTIRRIFNGTVTTVAGSAGVPGSADGRGAEARFLTPTAIAVDGRGNLFVCDSGNHTIRKVSPNGLVTTVAGLAGSAGNADGGADAARLSSPGGIVIAADGTIYIADTGNHRIRVGHVVPPPGERRRAVAR